MKFDAASLARLEDRLAKLGRKIAVKEYRTAVLIAGRMIAKTAREHLELNRRTGKLIKSLRVRVQSQFQEGAFVARISNTQDAFYGLFLETGTSHQAGTHWLSQALRWNESRVIPRMAEYLRERLPKLESSW